MPVQERVVSCTTGQCQYVILIPRYLWPHEHAEEMTGLVFDMRIIWLVQHVRIGSNEARELSIKRSRSIQSRSNAKETYNTIKTESLPYVISWLNCRNVYTQVHITSARSTCQVWMLAFLNNKELFEQTWVHISNDGSLHPFLTYNTLIWLIL